MKAMLLRETKPAEERPLELVDLPLPQPGPGEVRLRVRACGVCRTDLHTVEGDLNLPRLPLVPGHQIVGVVEARGDGATRYHPGQRVGVPWLYKTCGQCEFCRQGLENLCADAQFTGLHADGGYAKAMVVPEDFAYPIPDAFSDVAAAPLLCAGIIGYRALKLSRIRPGQRLGMYGFGGSAHVTIQVARHWGCEVYIFTRSKGHQELAHELGAAWVGRAEDTPPAKVHGAVIFAPAGKLVLDALRVLARGPRALDRRRAALGRRGPPGRDRRLPAVGRDNYLTSSTTRAYSPDRRPPTASPCPCPPGQSGGTCA
jgi:propanol-preferring alcohol dehydrogenase